MILQEEFKANYIELVTVTFGPSEMPDFNKPATVVKKVSAGYRQNNDQISNLTYCLLSDFTQDEINNENIPKNILRFFTLASEYTFVPTSSDTKLIWNSVSYDVNLVKVYGDFGYELRVSI